jgi:hypothetical protein
LINYDFWGSVLFYWEILLILLSIGVWNFKTRNKEISDLTLTSCFSILCVEAPTNDQRTGKVQLTIKASKQIKT